MTMITQDRRRFLGATATAFAALAASGCMTNGASPAAGRSARGSFAGYGALKPDPAGLLDLPEGFSYRILSRLGDAMDDGGTVPDKADGMGCFDLGNGEIALVRNHELQPQNDAGGPIAKGYGKRNGAFVSGGTTTIVLDAASLKVKRQFRSLGGTIRNCSGGVTPWGTWLTCEETTARKGNGLEQDHGWVFEVPASARGLVDPVPLKAMGRFNHEAAVVDPATGIVYQTEDRDDSVLYRFLPRVPGQLARGGRLQAMVIEGLADTRNWTSPAMPVGNPYRVSWVDLDDVEAPEDDLRQRAVAKGAALVARGEGLHMGVGRGQSEVFACCTSGGAKQLGQILKLTPGNAGKPDMVELFFESESTAQFNYGDNLTVAPSGHLIVCEDQYTEVQENHIRGITPDGEAYTLALLRTQTELAGGCFSPDGKVLFVNIYAPTATVAITGPWAV